MKRDKEKKAGYLYGLHAVTAAIEQGGVSEMWVSRGARDSARLDALIAQAQRARISVHSVPRATLDDMAPGAAHQGVVACPAARARVHGEADLESLLTELREPPLLLVLDGVQDPHNLGACLRSADAAGAHAVIAPRDRAAGITPAVRKVACGAAESVPFIQVTNLARTLRFLKEAGVWLIGAAGEAGQNVFDADLRGPLALVLGAEGEGMRRLTREHCDFLVRIPMRGRVESLNVSVAAGVCLFEAVRQRAAG